MKKRLTACICAAFLLCGCTSAKLIQSEDETGKTVLKLGHWLEGSEVNEPVHENVDLKAEGLKETKRQPYAEGIVPDEIIKRIREDYPDIDFNSWSVMIHFYDDEKTAGQISLRYEIGNEISTNKAITCGIENGKITDLWYANMDGSADEADLLARLSRFKASTKQETYELKEGEKLLEETTSYTYRYDTSQLIYTYNIFVLEPEGVINNDIGCEYVIESGS